MSDGENQYLSNTHNARESVARSLEELARSIRAGDFEYVALAYQRPSRPDSVVVVTGPTQPDYKAPLRGVGELLLRVRAAQNQGG